MFATTVPCVTLVTVVTRFARAARLVTPRFEGSNDRAQLLGSLNPYISTILLLKSSASWLVRSHCFIIKPKARNAGSHMKMKPSAPQKASYHM